MQADNKSYDDINVTPMVDLYLVLLLIFIIMTTAGVQGVKVQLPRGGPSTSKPIEGPKMQAVTVDNQGNIKLNATAVTLDELSSKLEAIKAAIAMLSLGRASSSITLRVVCSSFSAEMIRRA